MWNWAPLAVFVLAAVFSLGWYTCEQHHRDHRGIWRD